MPWSFYKRIQSDRRHSKAMRTGGMRNVRIWLPDTSRPDFEDICRRQAESVAEADKNDPDLALWMSANHADLGGKK